VSSIGPGFLILLGVAPDDKEEQLSKLAEKTAHLRVFDDGDGKMNLSVRDKGYEALVVSQFTLYADCRKGRRPSFAKAAPPERAVELYEAFCEHLAAFGVTVARGAFGERMVVSLENDGPVTIVLDTDLL